LFPTISPLNADYIRLGCAAVVIAREGECCTADDIMDVFKRALFLGDLDPAPNYGSTTRDDPSNWLHMEIEVPRCSLPFSQAALKVRPKQLYGVGRETVASVLLTRDALPGDRAQWEQMFDTFTPDDERDSAFSALAAIPFRDFPAHGRQELESIIAPKLRLARWFRETGISLPAFMAGNADQRSAPISPGARTIGRPHKPAWPRIVELVRQLHQEHPDWQKKQLAFEAWLRLTAEFSEEELPSVATIQRTMADILDRGSD
jgi:hypothetical protein